MSIRKEGKGSGCLLFRLLMKLKTKCMDLVLSEFLPWLYNTSPPVSMSLPIKPLPHFLCYGLNVCVLLLSHYTLIWRSSNTNVLVFGDGTLGKSLLQVGGILMLGSVWRDFSVRCQKKRSYKPTATGWSSASWIEDLVNGPETLQQLEENIESIFHHMVLAQISLARSPKHRK